MAGACRRGRRRARARPPRPPARRGELGVRAAVAERVEERAVRILRPVGEVAREPVRARSPCRRRRPGTRRARAAAPSPSATRRDGDRVQALARRVVVLPRHPDHDRVERPLERVERRAIAAQRAPPRARPTAARRTRRPPSAPGRALEEPPPQPGGKQREAAQRRRRECRERRLLVRVAAKAAEQARRVEHERRADHRHARRERALERERRAASRGCRAVSSSESALAARSVSGPQAPSSAPGPAVQDGLRRGHADDEVRLDQRAG